jgi:acyl-CoA reductase-like NAD-dependent aldehyde dehydrogenase
MIGNSLNKEVMDHQGGGIMGPVVSKGQYDKILNIIAQGKKQEGLKVLVGSDEEQAKLTAKHGEGYFITPTIFVDVPTESQLWKEEIFGPVLCVRVSDVFSCEFLFSSCVSLFPYESLLRCFFLLPLPSFFSLVSSFFFFFLSFDFSSFQSFTSEEEALQIANDSSYGLAGAVFSSDEAKCERVTRGLRCGIVWKNCCQPAFIQCPWGGVKKSGFGRELGRWGLEEFTSVKQVTSCSGGYQFGLW